MAGDGLVALAGEEERLREEAHHGHNAMQLTMGLCREGGAMQLTMGRCRKDGARKQAPRAM